MHTLPEALTFDDVLILPSYSEVLPTEVDTSVELVPGFKLSAPILSAAMDSVTETKMAIRLAEIGALGVLHKNCDIATQSSWVAQVKAKKGVDEDSTIDKTGALRVAAATGVGPQGLERALALLDAGCDAIVIDTAHGYSRGVLQAVAELRKLRKSAVIIAGNVAMADGAKALIDAGADVVKVGMGPGAICTTRVVSGVGVPQLYAIQTCAEVCRAAGKTLIGDGGIKLSGDVTKALAAGATAVMMGSMLAGTDEAPGELIDLGGKKVKVYRGMGSLAAMERGGKERYGQGGVQEAKKLVPEGIEGLVQAKGPVDAVVWQLVGGLRSGMGYVGAPNVQEIAKRARFVRITGASLQESHPHSLSAIMAAPNYNTGRS